VNLAIHETYSSLLNQDFAIFTNIKLSEHPRLLAWLLFLPAFLWGFSDTVLSLFQRWMKFDEAYGHGFLVLLIVIYLLFDRRQEVIEARSIPIPWLAIPLLLLSLLWFMAFQTDIDIVQQMALPLMLLLVIALVQGIPALKILWFPVAFLYFAIPAWDYLNDLLISVTVFVVSHLVRFSGITAYIEADRITLASGTIVIAAGCSGLRYLIICTALSALAAYLAQVRNALRIRLVLLGLLIGLATNWIRVYLLVLVGYFTEMESGLLHEHEMFGWVLFLFFFSPVYYLTSRMRQQPGPSNLDTAMTMANGFDRRQAGAWLLACLSAGSGPFAAHMADHPPAQLRLAAIDLSGYSGLASVNLDPEDTVYFFADDIHKPAMTAAAEYVLENARIQVASAIYTKNPETKNYLPYYRSVFNPVEWRRIREDKVSIAGVRRQLRIREIEIINKLTGDRKLIWYWFDIGGLVSQDEYIAKLLEVRNIVTGKNYAGMLLIQADCVTGCEDLREDFKGLSAHVDQVVTESLDL